MTVSPDIRHQTRPLTLRFAVRDWEGAPSADPLPGPVALRRLRSAEEVVALLERNRDLFDSMAAPAGLSVDALAEQTGRPAPTLYVTLRALEKLGFVTLGTIPRRTASRVEIVIDL
jgi:hypothetical protein